MSALGISVYGQRRLILLSDNNYSALYINDQLHKEGSEEKLSALALKSRSGRKQDEGHFLGLLSSFFAASNYKKLHIKAGKIQLQI